MQRRLPSAARLARLVLLAELLAGAVAYGVWRWLDASGTLAARSPLTAPQTELLLSAAALFAAALVLRSLVYNASTWQPSLPVSLLAVAATPVLGAWILRDLIARELVVRPQLAGVVLPHRTGQARMGNTKRLSEL